MLDETCTASVLNRTARVSADGSFFIADLPVEPGRHRVRVHCQPLSGPVSYGMSEPISLTAGALVEVDSIVFGEIEPIPQSLVLESEPPTLSRVGEKATIRVTGVFGDGSSKDLTADPVTHFWSSSPSIASFSDPDLDGDSFRLTAHQRGRVLVSARYEGVVASLEVDVAIPDDRDGDGLPDTFEEANSLDPDDPSDALADPDGDGLTNLEEFERGTSTYAADTDADGIPDGEEALGALDPTNPDTDGDGLVDGEELLLGTNPFDPDSDGDGLLDGDESELGLDPATPNPTTTLVGRVLDSAGMGRSGAAVVAFGRFATSSGIDGRFTLTPVPADQGPVRVFARTLESGRVLDGRSAEVAPLPAGLTDVGDVSLGEIAGGVSGQITDPDGSAVPFARVTVRSAVGERVVNADVTGFYGVERVAPGPLEVRGFDPRTALRGRTLGELAEGGSATLPVTVRAFGSVVGRVLERDRVTPAAEGVPVELERWIYLDDTQTDSLGRYRFDYVPASAMSEYLVSATDVTEPEDPDYGASLAAVTFTSQVVERNVTYLGKGRVNGEVRSVATGDLVSGAAVELTTRAGDLERTFELTATDGLFSVDGVWVGSFSARASHATDGTGSASGDIDYDGHSVDLTIWIDVVPVANLTGTVYRYGGQEEVEGAVVTAAGLRDVADDRGVYRIDGIPTSTWPVLVSFFDPVTENCGSKEIVIIEPNRLYELDFEFSGFGAMTVIAEHADGTPIGGAIVELIPEVGACGSQAETTDAQGVHRFLDVKAQFYRVRVTEPSCGFVFERRWVPVFPGETREELFTFEAWGRFEPRVVGSDGETSVPGVRVGLTSERGNDSQTTDTAGRVAFACKVASPYLLDVRSATGGPLLELSTQLSQHGEVVSPLLVLPPLGVVEGSVTRPDGQPSPNAYVRILREGQEFDATTADPEGFYRVRQVPIGDLLVRASEGLSLTGESEGLLTEEGGVARVDVELEGELIAADLYDANDYRYPVEVPGGNILEGSGRVFGRALDPLRGGWHLSLAPEGGTPLRFESDSNQLSVDGREVVLSGVHASGLQVERRVRVAENGYFVRYVELLSNPTGAPVTVDLSIDTYLAYLRNVGEDGVLFQEPAEILWTSSGDTLLDSAGASRDRWAVIGPGSFLETNPLLTRTRGAIPATGHLWSDEDSGAPSEVSYSLRAAPGVETSRVRAAWSSVTVPAGESVAVLHFGLQQSDVEASRASAERLEQLPPEALLGLEPFVLDRIRNFTIPAGGTSGLEPLPSLLGEIGGRVFEGDGETLVVDAPIRIRSEHPIFQRLQELRSDGGGAFSVAGRIGLVGGNVAVPVFPFVVEADHPRSFVMSPPYLGEFPAVSSSAQQNVLFVDTVRVEGTVSRSDEEVLDSGSVALQGIDALLWLEGTIDSEGRYRLDGVPPGEYVLVASQDHPQGSPIQTSRTVSVESGEPADAVDVRFPPMGQISGTITFSNGAVVAGAPVEIVGERGFRRKTRTGSGGEFQLVDLVAGRYTLRGFELDIGREVSVELDLAEGESLVQDLQFSGEGTVVLRVSFVGGQPASGASVSLFLDNRFQPRGTTGSDGLLRIGNVPSGEFLLRVTHPLNSRLFEDVVGEIPAAGEEVAAVAELPVDLAPQVVLQEPVAGAVAWVGGVLAVRGQASDDYGLSRAELFLNGERVASRALILATNRTVDFDIVLGADGPRGDVAVHLEVIDGAGQRAASAPASIQILEDTVPPTITSVGPDPAEYLEGRWLWLLASVEDDVRVEHVEFWGPVAGGEVQLLNWDDRPEGGFAAGYVIPPDYAPDGPRPLTIEVRAFDGAGNLSDGSVTYTVLPDDPPILTVSDAPSDGSVVRTGDVLRFVGTVDDETPNSVQLRVNGSVVSQRSQVTAFDLDFVVPLALQNSVVSLEVHSIDRLQQSHVFGPITVTVDADTLPQVTLFEPGSGAELVEGSEMKLSASASDDGEVVSVEFLVGAESVALDSERPFTTRTFLPVGDAGPVELIARATDDQGQTREHAISITRVDDTEPPTLSWNLPKGVSEAYWIDAIFLLDATSDAAIGSGLDVDGDGLEDVVPLAAAVAARELLAELNGAIDKVGIYRLGRNPSSVALDADLESVDDDLASFGPDTAFDQTLWSGLSWALRLLDDAPARRRAAPLIFAFVNDQSDPAGSSVVADLSEKGVAVHVIGIGPISDSTHLEELAEGTGGTYRAYGAVGGVASQAHELLGDFRAPVHFDATDNARVATVGVSFDTGTELMQRLWNEAPFVGVLSEPALFDPAAGLLTPLGMVARATDPAGNETVVDCALEADECPGVDAPLPPPLVQQIDTLSSSFPGMGRPGDTVELVGRRLGPGDLGGPVEVRFGEDLAVLGTVDKFRIRATVPAILSSVAVTVTVDGLTSNEIGFGLDSDRDGLTDEEEEALGTDPDSDDSDGDGLSDGAEVQEHGTDPLDPDTDGGGESDGDEVAREGAPLDPADDLWTLEIENETAETEFVVVTDPHGDLHLFQRDSTQGCLTFHYSMRKPNGAEVIAPTPLAECGNPVELSAAVDSQGRVHVAWLDEYQPELRTLDPALDDRDGDQADLSQMLLSEHSFDRVGFDTRVVAGSSGDVYLAVNGAGLTITRIDEAGTRLRSWTLPGQIASSDLSLDETDGALHVVVGTDAEILYALLDTETLLPRIAPTPLFDFPWVFGTAVERLGAGSVAVVAEIGEELWATILVPGDDEQDGDEANFSPTWSTLDRGRSPELATDDEGVTSAELSPRSGTAGPSHWPVGSALPAGATHREPGRKPGHPASGIGQPALPGASGHLLDRLPSSHCHRQRQCLRRVGRRHAGRARRAESRSRRRRARDSRRTRRRHRRRRSRHRRRRHGRRLRNAP